jgi:hypothetical protein
MTLIFSYVEAVLLIIVVGGLLLLIPRLYRRIGDWSMRTLIAAWALAVPYAARAVGVFGNFEVLGAWIMLALIALILCGVMAWRNGEW